MSSYSFNVNARAEPSLNGELKRIPRVLAWYQVIREAFYQTYPRVRERDRLERTGNNFQLAPPLVLKDGKRAKLTVHFDLREVDKRRQPDLAQLTKALEDGIFADDYHVEAHTVTVDRRAAADGVRVLVEIE